MMNEGNGIETTMAFAASITPMPQMITREEIGTRIRRTRSAFAVLYATTTVLADHVAAEKSEEGEILSDGGTTAYASARQKFEELVAGLELFMEQR